MFSPEEYMLPCLSKQLLGVECLGCGLQRSLMYLFRGEFVSAFKMYPAIYPLIFLFVFIGINFIFNFKYSGKIINSLAILAIVVIVGSYVIKIIN